LPLLVVQGFATSSWRRPRRAGCTNSAGDPKELVELGTRSHEFRGDRAAGVRIVCDWLEHKLSSPMKVPSVTGKKDLKRTLKVLSGE